jgi:hypothetical protein
MRVRRAVLAVVLAVVASASASCSRLTRNEHPVCDVRAATRLLAESVPSAAFVPCVRSLPIGWSFSGFQAVDGRGSFWLNSDNGGERALEVTFVRTCRPDGSAVRASGLPAGVHRYVDVRASSPYRAVWTETFPGGCARYLLSFVAGARSERLVQQLERGLSLIPRDRLG